MTMLQMENLLRRATELARMSENRPGHVGLAKASVKAMEEYWAIEDEYIAKKHPMSQRSQIIAKGCGITVEDDNDDAMNAGAGYDFPHPTLCTVF